MANSKLRCTSCRNYYDPNDEGTTKVGLAGVCSDECLEALKDRARSKRARRIVHRENKHRYGRRLPGQTRDKIRERDGVNCRYCGTPNEIQIHHIKYRSEGGGDMVINLISLCDEHHKLMHSSKRKWQPVLQMTQWLFYAEGMFLTVPEVERVFSERLQAELPLDAYLNEG